MLGTLKALIISCFLCSFLIACGDTVEIDAPILESVGVNLKPQKWVEPKVAPRPGLVKPPNAKYLPPPKEKKQAAKSENWPTDPDLLARKKAELRRIEMEKKAEASRADIDPLEDDVSARPKNSIIDRAFENITGRGNTEDEE